MKALILSGGKGTRLAPLTLYTPKPLLPVANLPFLNYPVSLLKKHGVSEVILCSNEDTKPYELFVLDRARAGSTVLFSRETKELGTAGALKNAEKFIDSPFFVFNGDILTNLDLSAMIAFHKAKKSQITFALIPLADPTGYGVIHTDASKRITRFDEKPSVTLKSGRKFFINGGIYLYEPEMLQRIPAGRKVSAEREIFPFCIKENVPIYGFEAPPETFWFDIGIAKTYLNANLSVVKNPKAFDFAEYNAAMGRDAQISHDSHFAGGVVVGPKTRIESGAKLKNCCILEGAVVGKGADLENLIVGPNAQIGEKVRIKNGKIIAPYSVISA